MVGGRFHGIWILPLQCRQENSRLSLEISAWDIHCAFGEPHLSDPTPVCQTKCLDQVLGPAGPTHHQTIGFTAKPQRQQRVAEIILNDLGMIWLSPQLCLLPIFQSLCVPWRPLRLGGEIILDLDESALLGPSRLAENRIEHLQTAPVLVRSADGDAHPVRQLV